MRDAHVLIFFIAIETVQFNQQGTMQQQILIISM